MEKSNGTGKWGNACGKMGGLKMHSQNMGVKWMDQKDASQQSVSPVEGRDQKELRL